MTGPENTPAFALSFLLVAWSRDRPPSLSGILHKTTHTLERSWDGAKTRVTPAAGGQGWGRPSR